MRIYGSSLDSFKHLQLACLNDANNLVALYSWKGIEEFVHRFPAFEVINQILRRNARANETGVLPMISGSE